MTNAGYDVEQLSREVQLEGAYGSSVQLNLDFLCE